MKRTLCVRCGRPGERRDRSPLCQDCLSVLTEDERVIWVGAESSVESSHGKDTAA